MVSTSALFRPISDDEDDAPPVASTSTSRARLAPSSPDLDADGDATMASATVAENGEDDTAPREVYEDSEPDSDPDDPLVSVLPVYLTPALSKHLALLQYPHRPPAYHTPYPLLPPSLRPDPENEDMGIRSARDRISARYKPKVGQLELSVPMEVREGKLKQRFNPERSEQLGQGQMDTDLTENGTKVQPKAAQGAAGRKKKEDVFEKGSDKPLERMTLSGEAIPDQTWYACALLRDSMHYFFDMQRTSLILAVPDEVHLTPLTRTVQMRAHLHYLDRLDDIALTNAKRERNAATGGGADGDSDSNAGGSGQSDAEGKSTAAEQRAAAKKRKEAAEKKRKEGENKAVQVKVDDTLEITASGDVKTARAAASLFGPKKAAEEEKWIDLPYHESTVSCKAAQPSVTNDTKLTSINFSLLQRIRSTSSFTLPATTSCLC